jgi:tetratricopeptide (TPR) repeat protein
MSKNFQEKPIKKPKNQKINYFLFIIIVLPILLIFLNIKILLADAYFNKGFNLEKDGVIDEAIYEYKKAIKFYPYEEVYHHKLGDAYREINEFEESLKSYKNALKLNLYQEETHFNLGLLYGKIGDFDNAIKKFEEVLKLDPYYYQAYTNLGIAYELKGEIKKAKQMYKKALSINKDHQLAKQRLKRIQKNYEMEK